MPHAPILLILAAALCCAAVAGILYCRCRTRLAQLNSQRQFIAINQELKELLGNIQQHRGMVSGYLNGDISFKYKISALQAEINRQTEHIAFNLHASVFHLSGFEAIQNLWRQLYPVVLGGTREQSFDAHCRLISTILNLIRDIAEHSQLHRDSGCPFSFVDIVWHLLPDTAEAIGQSRAIGTGIAAAGRSLSTERIKLGFLIMRIRDTVARLESGISRTPSNATWEALQQSHSVVRGHIDNLVTDIEQQLLSADRPKIDPTRFFNHASNTLNSVFELYDQGVTIARQDVESRQSKALRNSGLSLAAALTCCAFAAAVIINLNV